MADPRLDELTEEEMQRICDNGEQFFTRFEDEVRRDKWVAKVNGRIISVYNGRSLYKSCGACKTALQKSLQYNYPFRDFVSRTLRQLPDRQLVTMYLACDYKLIVKRLIEAGVVVVEKI